MTDGILSEDVRTHEQRTHEQDTHEQDIRAHSAVEQLVREAGRVADERRRELRVPFVRPVRIESAHGDLLCNDAFTRDITPMGIGLLHKHPVDAETLAIAVDLTDGEVRVRAEIAWTSPLRNGWFVSGARFA